MENDVTKNAVTCDGASIVTHPRLLGRGVVTECDGNDFFGPKS
jgi:hypothetical protein